MNIALSWLTQNLFPDPRRRWWAAVGLYALLFVFWLVFARVTVLLMNEPRGAPLPPNKLTWVDGEWRFGTREAGSGLVQHYLYDGKQRLTICYDTPARCARQLFPKSRTACQDLTRPGEALSLKDPQARCNQMQGKFRFSGEFTIGHWQGEASYVQDGEGRPVLYRPLVRPVRSQHNLVLLTILMLLGTLAGAWGLFRYAVPRLMLYWVQLRPAPAAAPAKGARPKLVRKGAGKEQPV